MTTQLSLYDLNIKLISLLHSNSNYLRILPKISFNVE